MTVHHLLEDLRRDGVTVSMVGGTLSLAGPREKLDASRVQMLRANKAEIQSHLAAEATADVPPTRCALSQGQLGIHLAERMDPLHRAFNVMFAMRLRPGISPDALRAALCAALGDLVRRHAQLRRRYPEDDGVPAARDSESAPDIIVGQRAGLTDQALRETAIAWAAIPFDLQTGPCFRARLWLDDTAPALAITVHHIAADLSCLPILCGDLAAFLRGAAPDRPARIFDDFVAGERLWLNSDAASRAGAFWQTALPCPLPDWQWPPAAIQGRGEARLCQQLGADVSQSVLRLARLQAVSPFVVFLTAYQIVLARFAGLRDIVIGAPVSNRPGRDYAGTVGDFTNLLPFPLSIGQESFATLLASTAKHLAEASDHARLPFRDIIARLGLMPPPHRPALLQATMSWHAAAPVRADDIFDGPLFAASQSGAPSELTVSVSQSGDGFSLEWQWHPRALDGVTTATIAHALASFLGQAVQNPTRPARALSLMDGQEEARQRDSSQQTRPFDTADIATAIRRQAALRPSATALLTEAGTITYAALDAQANRLACHLQRRGVAPGSTLGICLDRGPDFVIAMLAAAKLGAAYAPIDPGLPEARMGLMIADARMAVVVTDTRGEALLAACEGARVLLDAEAASIAACPDDAPQVSVSPDDAAYIIYTSGSTGVPKGVAVSHRNVMRLVDAMAEHVRDGDVLLHAASPAFDASTFEIWSALARGHACAILPPGVPDLTGLGRFIRTAGVTIAFLTTALFNAIVTEDPSVLAPLRVLLFGGEAASRKHVGLAMRKLAATQLLHVYGPTECTTFATLWPVKPRADRAIPIGRPIANTSAYILDDSLALLPPGAIGQLHLGGAGVAQGYLNDAALTQSRFIADPFSQGGTLYRTGDLARLLADGMIEFIGRADDQIKLRGFRIELSEIRAALLGVAGVRDAIVVLGEGEGADKRILAYVVAEHVQAGAIHDQIARTLPSYMLPAAIIPIDRLPLNASGKVDRRKLPAAGASGGGTARPPEAGIETVVAAMFAELLGIDSIGRDTDFFQSGGDSLKAMQLASRLHGVSGEEIGIATIFKRRTVCGIGAALAETGGREGQPC